MKSNIEKVYSKLPKTELAEIELATQKVELGLVDDFNDLIDKSQGFRKQAATAYMKVLSNMRAASTQMDLALKEAKKIDEAAKQIGVKSPVNTTEVAATAKGYQKAVNLLAKDIIN